MRLPGCHAEHAALRHRDPLLVAVDSNVLIDFKEHGIQLLDGDVLADEEKYDEELTLPGDALNLDIRFVTTPRSRTDVKHVVSRFESVTDGLVEARSRPVRRLGFPGAFERF